GTVTKLAPLSRRSSKHLSQRRQSPPGSPGPILLRRGGLKGGESDDPSTHHHRVSCRCIESRPGNRGHGAECESVRGQEPMRGEEPLCREKPVRLQEPLRSEKSVRCQESLRHEEPVRWRSGVCSCRREDGQGSGGRCQARLAPGPYGGGRVNAQPRSAHASPPRPCTEATRRPEGRRGRDRFLRRESRVAPGRLHLYRSGGHS